MKPYLTIKEFASLRNVNINSLRYYEKIGLLIPARIDKQTKYRYYLPKQLVVLDIIIFAVHLGLPLKILKDYIDENNLFDSKRLMSYYTEVLSKQISELNNELLKVKVALNHTEQNELYKDCTDFYEREIEERYIVVKPFDGNINDIKQKEKFAMDLFQYAQDKNMMPMIPSGVIIDYQRETPAFSFYFRILNPDLADKQVIKLTKAKFLCKQAKLSPNTDMLALTSEVFNNQKLKVAILSNMDIGKLNFNNLLTEIQAIRDY